MADGVICKSSVSIIVATGNEVLTQVNGLTCVRHAIRCMGTGVRTHKVTLDSGRLVVSVVFGVPNEKSLGHLNAVVAVGVCSICLIEGSPHDGLNYL